VGESVTGLSLLLLDAWFYRTSGRWSYGRMSKLIPYMFYKNITYSMAQFWFSILFAAWSGQKFYIEAGNTTVDVVFTGLPIIMLSVLDQVIPITVTAACT
jgi:magnesium-transporting ATPase (P-type)